MENLAETADLYSTLFAELKKLGVKVPKTKKFKSSIPREEKIVSPTEIKMFGVSLLRQEWSCDSGSPLPKFLAATTAYLLKYSKTVGLFRLAGSIKRQKNLRVKIENGEALEGSEPNDVASLLKQWLRELPEPLIPRCMHDLFHRCQQVENKENRVASTLLACLLLPAENLYALKHLISFLQKFAANCYENKMGSSNLALIMAPNIFVSRIDCMDKNCKSMVQVHTSVIELLIENCEKIGEIPPCVALHSAIQESRSTDSDSSGDVLGFENFKLNRKRRNGPVHDLFCNIKKLVGQNGALLKVQEKKSTALVPRLRLLSDIDESPLPKPKEVRNKLSSESRMNDLRKSFGLLRRKELKRSNFITSSQTNIALSCHQNCNADTRPDQIEGPTISNASVETKPAFPFCPKLKSESKNKSKSEYNVTLIGKESYDYSAPTSSFQNCIQECSRSSSLCWILPDAHKEHHQPDEPPVTQASNEAKNAVGKNVAKVPQISRGQGSLIRGRPNSVKSGLPYQSLNEQNYATAKTRSSKFPNENTAQKFKKTALHKTNTSVGTKKSEKYSMQGSESAKYRESISVSQPKNKISTKPSNFDPVISLPQRNTSAKQKINKAESTKISEKCNENLHIQCLDKMCNNSNSKIPRLRQSLELNRRNSFSEISKYNERKIAKLRLSDIIDSPFHSKIPVMSKQRVSTSNINDKHYKISKEVSPRIYDSISRLSDASYSNFSSPEETAFNKRESIAFILKNNPGHVKARVHLYDTLTPKPTEKSKKKLTGSSKSLNYSSQDKFLNYRRNAKISNVSHSCKLNEGKNTSKSNNKCQKPSPVQICCCKLQTTSPNNCHVLKEVTNVRFRFYNIKNFPNIRTQDKNAFSKLTCDNCYGNKKCKKLKSNSFSGCKTYKVSESISRSASSPGCPKPGNRLLRVIPAYSNQSLAVETIDEQNMISVYPLTHKLKTGSSLSLEKLKTDVMIDEWQCEL